ncbi:bud emergence protein 1 [Modicella reniformis]|uniref:Bud emergence protein 1 n=1 Tax=Modicella reniformis TaxID=1440133 RepID=A0A9P6LSR7_9FUNG|nr:bud emergence protein 1 [Modicella reniformis]
MEKEYLESVNGELREIERFFHDLYNPVSPTLPMTCTRRIHPLLKLHNGDGGSNRFFSRHYSSGLEALGDEFAIADLRARYNHLKAIQDQLHVELSRQGPQSMAKQQEQQGQGQQQQPQTQQNQNRRQRQRQRQRERQIQQQQQLELQQQAENQLGYYTLCNLPKPGFQMFGVVIWDVITSKWDELKAKRGDNILIIGQSDDELQYVARDFRGRLGLISKSVVDIRDVFTGKSIDVKVMLRQAGKSIPKMKVPSKKTSPCEFFAAYLESINNELRSIETFFQSRQLPDVFNGDILPMLNTDSNPPTGQESDDERLVRELRVRYKELKRNQDKVYAELVRHHIWGLARQCEQREQQQIQPEQEQERQLEIYDAEARPPPFRPLYGVVLIDWNTGVTGDLEAKIGDSIMITGQADDDWYMGRPIGRLGTPGLIPMSFVELKDMTTGEPVDFQQLIRNGLTIRRVEARQPLQRQQQNPPAAGGMAPTPEFQPLYGTVVRSFGTRPSHLKARTGDRILIIHQTGEWCLAKHIGRPGGPGLIPFTSVRMREKVSVESIDVQQMLRAVRQIVRDPQQDTIPPLVTGWSLGRFTFIEVVPPQAPPPRQPFLPFLARLPPLPPRNMSMIYVSAFVLFLGLLFKLTGWLSPSS